MAPITFRRAILVVAAVAAASVASVAGLRGGATPTQGADPAFALGQRLAAGAYWAHGILQDPPAIASRTSSLNAALGACLTSNGATRVSIAGGGWTYRDPTGAAGAACKSQQDAVNAFADGSEMTGYSRAIQPIMDAYWSCMVRRGLDPPNPNANGADHFNVDPQAHNAGADTCSAEANSKFGVAVPARSTPAKDPAGLHG